MSLFDRIYFWAFARTRIYTLLFEDNEVDLAHFALDERSRVLAISAAGCGVAGFLSRQPARIDAVDTNHHHLALAALRVASSKKLGYEEHYQLFGHGQHPRAEQLLKQLVEDQPDWIRRYWSRNHRLFARNLYRTGLLGRLFGSLRSVSGIDEAYLRRMARLPPEERYATVVAEVEPYFHKWYVTAMLRSPVMGFAQGVNGAQRDRLIRDYQAEDLAGVWRGIFRRMAATDYDRNWFLWYGIAGHFNHDLPDAVQPYLRAEHHQHAHGGPTTVELHHRNIFDLLGAAKADTWTHYSLCDAIDWMPEPVQRRLLSEVVRTASPGGRLLYRTTEDLSVAGRLGLDKHLRLLEAETMQASAAERSKLYRRVNVYEVVK